VVAAQVSRIEVDALGGNDLIDLWSLGGWSGTSVVRAGAGNDVVDGSSGGDRIEAGDGDDNVWGEGVACLLGRRGYARIGQADEALKRGPCGKQESKLFLSQLPCNGG
jgi:Ca2+-binding RTX toxin-like protein